MTEEAEPHGAQYSALSAQRSALDDTGDETPRLTAPKASQASPYPPSPNVHGNQLALALSASAPQPINPSARQRGALSCCLEELSD